MIFKRHVSFISLSLFLLEDLQCFDCIITSILLQYQSKSMIQCQASINLQHDIVKALQLFQRKLLVKTGLDRDIACLEIGFAALKLCKSILGLYPLSPFKS